MTDVEKVARAIKTEILRGLGYSPDARTKDGRAEFSARLESTWPDCVPHAEAAIRALTDTLR